MRLYERERLKTLLEAARQIKRPHAHNCQTHDAVRVFVQPHVGTLLIRSRGRAAGHNLIENVSNLLHECIGTVTQEVTSRFGDNRVDDAWRLGTHRTNSSCNHRGYRFGRIGTLDHPVSASEGCCNLVAIGEPYFKKTRRVLLLMQCCCSFSSDLFGQIGQGASPRLCLARREGDRTRDGQNDTSRWHDLKGGRIHIGQPSNRGG